MQGFFAQPALPAPANPPLPACGAGGYHICHAAHADEWPVNRLLSFHASFYGWFGDQVFGPSQLPSLETKVPNIPYEHENLGDMIRLAINKSGRISDAVAQLLL